MNRKHTLYTDPHIAGWRMDDEEEKEEQPKSDLGMFSKKLERYFFEKRAVYLWGVVDDKSAKDVVSKLLLLDADKPGEEIKFYINSPGGVVTSGMVMYDTMQMIKSPVSTICMGLAASMGSILLSGGQKGKRYIFPHGEVMIHQPSGGMQGQFTDMEISYKLIKSLRKELYDILAHHTGKTFEEIEKDSERDNWMTSHEAKNYGIVDEVLDRSNPRKKDL